MQLSSEYFYATIYGAHRIKSTVFEHFDYLNQPELTFSLKSRKFRQTTLFISFHQSEYGYEIKMIHQKVH